MRTLPLIAATLCACLVSAGCSSEDAAPQVADLQALLPSADDAPDGLVFGDRVSGPADLESFRGDPAGRAALEAAGFRSAWTALFANRALLGFFILSRPGERPPENGRLLTDSVVLFADAAGASEATTYFEREARSELDEAADAQATPGGFAIRGSIDGQPAIALGAATEELVVLVRAQGEIPPADADAVFERTLGAAHDAVAG